MIQIVLVCSILSKQRRCIASLLAPSGRSVRKGSERLCFDKPDQVDYSTPTDVRQVPTRLLNMLLSDNMVDILLLQKIYFYSAWILYYVRRFHVGPDLFGQP
ncbi:MAG: hypothetical protein J07HR59_01181 [Halorubrum sp. J07HR59]|nr:MAG: hypothetical protein J07HR59_01181 [Halorubrum sp. J07HR59]